MTIYRCFKLFETPENVKYEVQLTCPVPGTHDTHESTVYMVATKDGRFLQTQLLRARELFGKLQSAGFPVTYTHQPK